MEGGRDPGPVSAIVDVDEECRAADIVGECHCAFVYFMREKLKHNKDRYSTFVLTRQYTYKPDEKRNVKSCCFELERSKWIFVGYYLG